MKLMKFIQDDKNISIIIPIAFLAHLAKHHPDEPMIIKDKNAFAMQVLFELEHNLGQEDSGLTGLQELIDKACTESVVNVDDTVAEFKDDI